jgi:hypothetical protein
VFHSETIVSNNEKLNKSEKYDGCDNKKGHPPKYDVAFALLN